MTWLPLLALLVGVLLTGTLAYVSARNYHRNEQRLLRLRVRDAGSLLTESLPAVQTPLVSAAALADATGADETRFRRFIAPYAGVSAGYQFVSVSLWRANDPQLGPVLVAGARPKLKPGSSQAVNVLAAAARSPTLHVVGLLREPDPRIGYAFATAGAQNRNVA